MKIKEQPNSPTMAQKAALNEALRKVSKLLETWYDNLSEFMPSDALKESLDVEHSPEKATLYLPSSYPIGSHQRLGLVCLAETEFRLRVGLAYEALEKLRNALGIRSFFVRRKYEAASGQPMLLRSNEAIERSERQVSKWKETYKRARRAIVNLKGDCDTLKHLKELREEDCITISAWMEEHRYWITQGERAEVEAAQDGGGRTPLPWIWKMALPESEGGSVTLAVQGMTNEGTCFCWI
jgi:hypothetical protein